ncbi:MAG: hypothetical protein RM049_13630 [Nostoc sp. DedQUE04]|uniref:hypothetical protein n=1 Tax=unclassified Nostoc TaxID=2593658 RepID=UPI002AD2EAB6|nr:MULTISPECIES: hypothetical protein [unclassified Nostoc]MDZ8096726.1 hypothetical protein [Nostoc sp. DedQUE05]MDZ8136328.1 hypothetical protein [Nostoc sp. DedQUE04]
MEITLIRDDGERKTIRIPELDNYPEILFAGGHAFKKHPQTDEYVECSYWHVPLAESWDFLK